MINLTSDEFERDYRVLKEIGRGRFGEAVSVEHLATGEQYALKRTRFGSTGQPDAQKVQVEANALARLQHANVIRYHATFFEPGAVCILMELATGGDLGTVLARRWKEAEAEGQHELPEDELMSWFVQLAAGLEHVHKMRVLHRDLKPENVFVSGDGTAKLGDFGIARILQVARRTPAAATLRLASDTRRPRRAGPMRRGSPLNPPPSTLRPPPSTLHAPRSALHPPPSTVTVTQDTTELARTTVGSPCYLSPEIVQGAS